MTPTRMRECLALLRWSQRGLADAIGGSEGVVRMMARGAREIPPELASWLETLATVHAAHPPPTLTDGRTRAAEALRAFVGADQPLPRPTPDMEMIVGTKR